jgi:photosystem II stability/assembly factor-like uncharacterized protein
MNNGIAVGIGGTILKTTDSGINWMQQTSGIGNFLYDVSYPDSNNATIVGSSGKILRTTDGGQNWFSQSSGTSNDLYGVFFIDSTTGTAVGSSGTILRTTNSGTNWTSQTSGTTYDLNSVFFTNANNGVAVGGIYNVPYEYYIIKRTTNGGTTWTTVGSGDQTILQSVCFADENIGYTVGHSSIMPTSGIRKTTNGGLNWSYVAGFTMYVLDDIFSPDINNITIVGESPYGGIILSSSSGGSDWIERLKGTTAAFYGVSFSNSVNGIVVGSGGTILRTTDSLVTIDDSKIKNNEPTQYKLFQNYPNPFNPTTSLKYAINSRQFVTLKVYDLLGREIATLVNEVKPAGEFEVEFNAASHSGKVRNLPSGIYFYQLNAGDYKETKKMVLLK